MLARTLGVSLLLSAAAALAPASAEDMIGFPREDFGKVVLSQRQVAGGVPEAALGAYANEPISNYGQRSFLYQLGRSVGRLDVLTNVRVFPCTAFLISSKYVLTNYHCVPGVTELPEAQMIGVKRIEAVQLKLGYTRQGVEEGAKSFTVSPAPVEADKGFDYAILEVFGEPAAEFGVTRLAALQPTEKSPLIIIGHPLGWAQHISLLRCRSDDPAVSASRLRHTCDTLPGNSGSPVFDADSRAAIALHHAGSAAQSINYAVPLSNIVAKSKVLQQILRDQGGAPASGPHGAQVALNAPPAAAPPRAAAPSVAVPTPRPAACTSVEVDVAGQGTTCLNPANRSKREFQDCFVSKGKHICGPKMVVVPAGKFLMGSPAGEASEVPQHEVTFERPFAVGRFSVTNGEWRACVQDEGCSDMRQVADDTMKPITMKNWHAIESYVAWLSAKTGKPYRLLSEAEREYVTRAGTVTAFWWGEHALPKAANFKVAGNGRTKNDTMKVGSFDANPWGIYDVHGNISEIVEDCWHPNYVGAPNDGSAWTSNCAAEASGGGADLRVIRGGSWRYSPTVAQAATRGWHTMLDINPDVGFRIARAL